MPDVVDYLGAPKVVTGADYMHALAALGFNVENMSSPIPTMTKIASAQTNFLDNLYNQNLDRQAKQANLQEALARANNLQSVTDYNNQSLDLRLKDLDYENQQRKQQIDFAAQAQPFKQKALETQDTLNNLAVLEEQRKWNESNQARDQFAKALPELPDPRNDPDFKTKFDKWNIDNAAVLARDDSIGKQARMARDNVRKTYEGTSRYVRGLADVTEFEGYQGKDTPYIDKSFDADKTVFGNPALAQSLLVQARALHAQSELQQIITDPTIPQAYRDKLDDAFTYVHNYVSSKTGVQDIQRGEASLYFNPDGKLNSTARAMVDGIKALKGMKQPQIKARLPVIGVTGEVAKGEQPYQDFEGTPEQYAQRVAELRAQQAGEQRRKAEMADIPDTPENLEDKAAHQRNEISLEELHRRINARNAARARPAQNLGPLGRAQAGFQAGGLVTGTPGPDQVPANLTSGEFVVNRDAVADVGLPALEALNAGYTGTPQATGIQPPTSTGTQQDVQFQQPAQPSAFQQLFGPALNQYGTTDAPPPTPLPNIPVRAQIPVIRPQLAQPTRQTEQPATQTAQTAQTTQTPRAEPVSTPAVTTGPATIPLTSTGGTTLMPRYTTGDAFLNAHYLGDGKLSGLATNFGHDVNGRPDTYMLSKLGGSSRIGAFGTDVVNPTTVGASVPLQTFRAFVGNPNDPQVRQRVKSGRVGVEVWAPNGRSARFPIVDLGPGKGENASLDLTGSAMRQLGVSDNFGAVYRIYSE